MPASHAHIRGKGLVRKKPPVVRGLVNPSCVLRFSSAHGNVSNNDKDENQKNEKASGRDQNSPSRREATGAGAPAREEGGLEGLGEVHDGAGLSGWAAVESRKKTRRSKIFFRFEEKLYFEHAALPFGPRPGTNPRVHRLGGLHQCTKKPPEHFRGFFAAMGVVPLASTPRNVGNEKKNDDTQNHHEPICQHRRDGLHRGRKVVAGHDGEGLFMG